MRDITLCGTVWRCVMSFFGAQRRQSRSSILKVHALRTGEILTFKKGAGLFAVELGVPVVPAYIEGARGILAKGKFVPRPGSVTVRFGEPIRFASEFVRSRAGRRLRKAAVELLEQRIRGLSESPSAGDWLDGPMWIARDERREISTPRHKR